jgi:hypothetical protein
MPAVVSFARSVSSRLALLVVSSARSVSSRLALLVVSFAGCGIAGGGSLARAGALTGAMPINVRLRSGLTRGGSDARLGDSLA